MHERSHCDRPKETAFATENLKDAQETQPPKTTLNALYPQYERPKDTAFIAEDLSLELGMGLKICLLRLWTII